MRCGDGRRTRSYNRVLLAVHWLTGDDGICWAGDEEIGTAAGRSGSTVRSCLRSLEAARVVRTFGREHGLGQRVVVPLDHPRAAEARRFIDREFARPYRRMVKVLRGA